MKDGSMQQGRKPDWLKVRIPAGENWRQVSRLLAARGLATVCDSAKCPNKAECWGASTATFMVLGSVCTRACRFCAVSHAAAGESLRAEEPRQLAEAVAELSLKYAVVTSVDRDDLGDRGAAHFGECVRAIKSRNPGVRVEVLIPDYREGEIELILASRPDVVAHNLETVRRLQGVRDRRASYDASLRTLRLAASAGASAGSRAPVVKSSLLLGLGESREEVFAAMDDLVAAGCTSLVMGQYLRPTSAQIPVASYLSPETFAEYAAEARSRGFVSVVASPLARTSYHARASFEEGKVEKRIDYKVPGGKLIRVAVEIDSGLVRRVKVAGDFFAHPENLFEEAEASLVALPPERLPAAAAAAFSREGLVIFGASASDIAEALGRAVGLGAAEGSGGSL